MPAALPAFCMHDQAPWVSQRHDLQHGRSCTRQADLQIRRAGSTAGVRSSQSHLQRSIRQVLRQVESKQRLGLLRRCKTCVTCSQWLAGTAVELLLRLITITLRTRRMQGICLYVVQDVQQLDLLRRHVTCTCLHAGAEVNANFCWLNYKTRIAVDGLPACGGECAGARPAAPPSAPAHWPGRRNPARRARTRLRQEA